MKGIFMSLFSIKAKTFGCVIIIMATIFFILSSFLARNYPQWPDFFDPILSLEDRFFDFRMKSHLQQNQKKKSQNIVLVEIDDLNAAKDELMANQ